MGNRLFFVTTDPVPYGTANANYIRNFSKAVAYIGWNVIVIGMKQSKELQIISETFSNSKMIRYFNINKSAVGGKNYLDVYFNGKKDIIHAIKNFKPNQNDFMIVYSNELSISKAVLDIKEIPIAHKAYCEVEWFQPFQYSLGKFAPLYILWEKGFRYRAKNFQKAFPISKKLSFYCELNNCSTLVVPALTDSSEVKFSEDREQKKTIDFVYPGAASDKDSFPCMLTALSMLNSDEKKKVRFHLTSSMCKKKLRSLLKDDSVLDLLEQVIIYHGWMEYKELISLYEDSDFLLLARANNTVTVSNFPSKVPEMMNYGIIPVCSKVGDYTEVYLREGYDSLQFEEDNVNSCLAAIRKAIMLNAESIIEMRKNARNTAAKKFDFTNWGDRIIQFLEE